MAAPDKSAPAVRTSDVCNFLALRQATRHVSQLYDRHLAHSGLKSTQFSVLARLAQDGPLPVSGLADALVVDRTTLARNLRPLERDGLVSMQRDPLDARRRRLALTARGAGTVQRYLPAWQAAQDAFETAFGDAAAGHLRGLLHRVSRLPL